MSVGKPQVTYCLLTLTTVIAITSVNIRGLEGGV